MNSPTKLLNTDIIAVEVPKDANINKIGEVFKNKRGESATIINYKSYKKVEVIFSDGTKAFMIYGNLLKGSFSNKNTPAIYKIGFVGYGKYNTSFHKKTTDIWIRMLERCYSNEQSISNSSYKGCSVIEEWHNFQNFCNWFYEHYIDGWQLDKDILQKGNKIYSPETCCFVPQEINKLFTKRTEKRGSLPIGVTNHLDNYLSSIKINKKTKHIGIFKTPEEAFQSYKTTKEAYIKEMSDKWRGKINERVYEKMISYKVEISD